MVNVEVTGAKGATLNLSLVDMQSRIIDQSHTEQAGQTEQYHFDVSTQLAGVLPLRVSTPDQSKTVRILKSN